MNSRTTLPPGYTPKGFGFCEEPGCTSYRRWEVSQYCAKHTLERHVSSQDQPSLGWLLPLEPYGDVRKPYNGWLWEINDEEIVIRFAVFARRCRNFDLVPLRKDPYRVYCRERGYLLSAVEKNEGGHRIARVTLDAVKVMFPLGNTYCPSDEQIAFIDAVCPS